MILTDPYIQRLLHTNQFVEYLTQAAFAVGVILVGKLLLKLRAQKVDRMRAFDEGDEFVSVFSK